MTNKKISLIFFILGTVLTTFSGSIMANHVQGVPIDPVLLKFCVYSGAFGTVFLVLSKFDFKKGGPDV